MSEFKIFRLPALPSGPAGGPPAEPAAIDDNALTEAAIAEHEGLAPAVLSRTPLPGQRSRGRDLELVRGRGAGGCTYVVTGYTQQEQAQHVRSWVDNEEDEDEEQRAEQTVGVRRR